MNFIILGFALLIIFTSSLKCESNIPSQVNWYPSSPTIKLNQIDICPISTGVYLSQCLYPPYQRCCLLYTKECGLYVICIQQNNQLIIKELKLIMLVQDMLIQLYSTNLWIADSNFIYLYDIAALNQDCCQLIFKQEIAKEAKAGDTISIQYFQYITGRLFISCIGGVYIYDISIPVQPKFISSIPANQRAQRLAIAPEINTIFLVDGNYQILTIQNPQEILNPSKPINILQKCQFPFPFVILNEVVDNKYLIVQSVNSIVSGVDLTTFLTSGKCSDLNFKTLFSNGDSYTFAYMTLDRKYVILSLINVSLQVVQIDYSPVLQGKLFQRIPFNGYLYYFQVSIDQSFVLISNQYTIDIYQRKEKPNYNLIIPSIINIPQVLAYEDTVISQTPLQPYGCQYTPINNYLVYTKGLEGAYIMQEDKDSHFLFIKKAINPINFSSSLRMSRVFNNERTLIIGRDSWIFIYDISDISNPVQLSAVDFGFKGIQIRQGYITKNMQYALLSGDIKGVLVVDISDLTKPKLITKIYHDFPLVTKCYCVEMPSNEKYAIASYQKQGLVIYDFSDFTNPKILSYFTNYSAYTHQFMKNENFIIKADLVSGITIIDVSNMQHPTEYSSINVDGTSKECVLIRDDQFMLCTSQNLGQLRLVDLRDLKNPYVLQKYDYKDFLGGYNVCVNTDQSILYLGLLSAIVRVSLYPNLQFETDLLLLQQGQIIKNEFLDIQQTLQVGMKVKATLIQVYPDRKAIITGAKFYSNYKIQELPYWASFSVIDSSLTIELNQNSLQTGSKINQIDANGATTYSIQFVFLTNQKILKTDFINLGLNIDSPMSNQIFIDCILSNIINHEYYFIETTFEIINYLLQPKYPINIVQYIFYVLSRKNIYYPILLKVQNSLIVEIGNEKKLPQISSIYNYLFIELYVNSTIAQFIPNQYSGVLTYLSDKRDWMKLEGDLNSVNLILQKGIHLANFTDPKAIPITISFDDSVNFVITKTLNASQRPIIRLNQQIKNNPDLSLQDDFEKKFANGFVYILETFSFTINPLVFINPDDNPIKYEAYIFNDDQYLLIPQQYWLLFQKEERTFVGVTKTSQYKDVVKILVNVTDGYTYAIDYLEIQINLVPISYILMLLFQILSPIVGFLGLWKYRSNLYNKIYKNKFETTKIEFTFGQEIVIQIPLLGNKLKLARQLWTEYFKQVNKMDVIREFNIEKDKTYKDVNISNKLLSPSKIIEQSQEQKLPTLQDSKIVSSHTSQSKNIVRYQQQFVKKFSKQIVRRNIYQQNQKQLSQDQNQGGLSQIGFKYFNSDNTLNSIQITKNVLDYYKQTHQSQNSKILDQLVNPLSMLSRAVAGLAVIQFSQFLDKSIQKVVNYLKLVSKQEGYKENDWYKCYLKIQPQSQRIHLDQFPMIILQEEKLQKIIENLFSSLQQQDSNQDFKQKIPFIKDIICAHALGFTLQKGGIIPKIRGECLELKSHDIQSIKTFRPVIKNSYCLRRKHEALVTKEFSGLQEIPSWVQSVDMVNNVILIKGKSEDKDIGKYVLNIYDNQNFIQKQLRIIIMDKLKEDNLSVNQQLTELFFTQDYVKSPKDQHNKKIYKDIQKYTEEDVPLESIGINEKYFEQQAYNSKSNQQQLNTQQANSSLNPFGDSIFS